MRTEILRDLGTDVRFGARALRRAPGFTLVAILTLALGIGANVAVFGMLRGILIDPIPAPRGDRLIAVLQYDASGGDPANQISYGDYVDLRARRDLFEDVALIDNASATVIGARGPERVNGRRVSPALFRLLGIRPMIGRGFAPQGSDADAKVTLLAYDFWATRLGADTSIVGATVRLGDEAHTVLGVLPPGVDFPYPSRGTQLWLPLYDAPDRSTNRQYWGYWAVARPAPNVTVARLQTELDAMSGALQAAHPESNAGRRFTTRDLVRTMVGDRRTALLALAGGAAFVLLIACTNLTNLLLARGLTRRRETAVRAALGAGAYRIVRRLAVETLLLAVASGLAGVALAAAVLRTVSTFGIVSNPRVDERMLALAGGLAVIGGLLCGIWPAIAEMRGVSHDTLRASARSSLGRQPRRVADALVSAEVALAFVLLVGSGLMFATVARALDAAAGFDRRDALAFRVFPARDRYPDRRSILALYERVSRAVDALPGVERTAVTSALPLGNRMGSALTRQDRPPAPGTTAPGVAYAAVRPGYFRAMGIPVIAGRDFSDRDLADSTHVAIISARTAREVFAGENPIGKRVALGVPQANDWHTVVGVVGDVRQEAVTDSPVRGAYALYGEHWDRAAWIVVRAGVPAAALIAPIRERLREIDGEMPMYEVGTMDERAATSIADRRLLLRLLALFSGIAAALCAVGIYGVTTQSVWQRRSELGIRMALGATGGRVRRDVLRQSALIAGVGLVVGGAIAVGATRLLRALLYDVRATDPMAFGGAAVTLGCIAVLAAWLPARRASRVDPMEVMRTD